MASIILHIENKIAKITLNRPEKFNSFNREMALQLQEALLKCAEDESVRVIVLQGEGKAFSAGQDLNEVVDPEGPELQSIVREHYNPIVRKIRTIEKPVICAVNGVAAGAGANIALAGDIVLAKKSASFIQAFSKIGLIPDSGGTFTLPRLIGFQKASALMILGDKVTAEAAEKMGMVYKVIEDDEFEAAVQKMAELLAEMPTKGIGMTKRALNVSLTNDLDTQLEVEEMLQTEAGHTYDYNEGVQAFLEKRKPVFKGS